MTTDISYTRILRWSIACVVVFCMYGIVFGTGMFYAKAETGSIVIDAIDDEDRYSFHYSVTTNVPCNFTLFRFYNTAFNYINSWNVGLYTASKSFDTTFFSCVEGCTGGGVVWYDTNFSKIYWAPYGDFRVSSEYFKLDYDRNIFENLTYDFYSRTPSGLSISQPIAVISEDNGYRTLPNTGETGYYYVVAGSRDTNYYEITYPVADYFLLSVNKGDDIPVKYVIHNYTSLYAAGVPYSKESTFNLNDFNFYSRQYDGIYVNVSTEAGFYEIVSINLTGAGGDSPPGTVPDGTSPSGQITIYGTMQYGQVYGVQAVLANENYSEWDRYYIKLMKPDGTQEAGTPKSFSSQSYDTGKLWYFNQYGMYYANLSYCAWYNVLCDATSSTLIDTAKTQIIVSNYTYVLSTDKANYNVGEVINITVYNPSPNTAYLRVRDSKEYITNMLNPDKAIAPGQNISVLLTAAAQIDKYNVRLYADTGIFEGELVKSVVFNITQPAADANFLSVAWSIPDGGTLGIMGETGTLHYSANWNATTIELWKQLDNVSTLSDTFSIEANVTSTKDYLFDVNGEWKAKITDGSTTKWANISVVISSAETPDNYNLPTYIYFEENSYFRGDNYVINYRMTPTVLVITKDYNVVLYNPDGEVVYHKTILNWDQIGLVLMEYPLYGEMSGQFTASAKIGQWRAAMYYGGTNTSSYLDGKLLGEDFAYVVQTAAEVTPTIAPEERTTDMLNNEMYWAVFIIITCVAMGSGFGLGGMILGAGIGVLGAFLLGWIPLWILFFIAAIIFCAGAFLKRGM